MKWTLRQALATGYNPRSGCRLTVKYAELQQIIILISHREGVLRRDAEYPSAGIESDPRVRC